MSSASNTKVELATFAGGCFWCMVSPFEELPGIHGIVSGYTGGSTVNPTYEEVCAGGTGHYEAVQIQFDPAVFPYRKLLGSTGSKSTRPMKAGNSTTGANRTGRPYFIITRSSAGKRRNPSWRWKEAAASTNRLLLRCFRRLLFIRPKNTINSTIKKSAALQAVP